MIVESAEIADRDKEIERLRFEEGLTLQEIGDRFDISRERVRQVVGNTGWIANKKRIAYVRSQIGKTNQELVKETGLSINTISRYRGDLHHMAGTDTESLVKTGNKWER